jgi:hypothetical protein
MDAAFLSFSIYYNSNAHARNRAAFTTNQGVGTPHSAIVKLLFQEVQDFRHPHQTYQLSYCSIAFSILPGVAGGLALE